MNWQHLQALLWLRWRLLVNHWRRGGAFNAMLMIVVAWCALVLVVPLFIASLALGILAFPHATPVHLLYAWDGLLVAFLFFWGIGLMTDLQRTESLSLAKFMHLPVSIRGAFLINYASSLLRLSLIVFVPAMLGLGLAMVYVKGPRLLVIFPLLLAFLLLVTALTYQFQGWLASLMSNPRHRRTVVVAATMLFVLVLQLPNLVNVAAPWRRRAEQSQKLSQELVALNQLFQSQEIDAQEHLRRQQETLERHQRETQAADQARAQQWEEHARWINLAVLPGWLPLGVMTAAEGHLLPSLCACLGLMLLGAGSLWRAYRTTVQLYLGHFTARDAAPPARRGINRPPAATSPVAEGNAKGSRKPSVTLLELRLPLLSETVSAIALAGFRSLTRAPEAKMMLLTPLLLGAFFGWGLLKRGTEIPISARPLVAIAVLALAHFGTLQLMANQFGFDRDGFRVFVLSAAARRDILLGKNLALLPLAVGVVASMLALVQWFCPLRLDHLLALAPQFISMFLLFCLLSNLLSIYAPLPIAAGAMRPSNPKLVPILLQMSMFFCLFPWTQAAALIPVGIEAGLQWLGWSERLPISLVLSLLECAVILYLYHIALSWEGRLLQAREQRILETVTGRAV